MREAVGDLLEALACIDGIRFVLLIWLGFRCSFVLCWVDPSLPLLHHPIVFLFFLCTPSPLPTCSVWQETKEPVLESIQTNFDRGDDVVGVNVKVGGGAGDHDHDHEHGHHHGGATGEQGEDDKTTDSETESTYEGTSS